MAYLNVSLENGDLDKVSKSLTMQTTRALMAIFKYDNICQYLINYEQGVVGEV